MKARCHKYQNTCKAQEKESRMIVLFLTVLETYVSFGPNKAISASKNIINGKQTQKKNPSLKINRYMVFCKDEC